MPSTASSTASSKGCDLLVNLKDLFPGNKVEIVSQWNLECYENSDGKMDKYLGTIMTVREITSRYALMNEDDREWAWYPAAIARIIQDEDEFEVASSDELDSFILGSTEAF